MNKIKTGRTNLSGIQFLDTSSESVVVYPPGLEFTVTATSEDDISTIVNRHGPYFRPVGDKSLDAVLRREVPELHESIFRCCE